MVGGRRRRPESSPHRHHPASAMAQPFLSLVVVAVARFRSGLRSRNSRRRSTPPISSSSSPSASKSCSWSSRAPSSSSRTSLPQRHSPQASPDGESAVVAWGWRGAGGGLVLLLPLALLPLALLLPAIALSRSCRFPPCCSCWCRPPRSGCRSTARGARRSRKCSRTSKACTRWRVMR